MELIEDDLISCKKDPVVQVEAEMKADKELERAQLKLVIRAISVMDGKIRRKS